MYKIATLGSQFDNMEHFVRTTYQDHPRPILFWDTCALLDLLRHLARVEAIDNSLIYQDISKIYSKIKWGKIYSVSSSVNSKEWDDNVDAAITLLSNNLPKVLDWSRMIIEAKNKLENTNENLPMINIENIKNHIVNMATTIVKKTIFLDVDKDVAYNALTRVTNKRPPSNAAKSSKAEFKDCSIWEVMLELCRKTNATGIVKPKLFYTINTDDFCTKDIGKPFDRVLLSEAATLSFVCCKTPNEVISHL